MRRIGDMMAGLLRKEADMWEQHPIRMVTLFLLLNVGTAILKEVVKED